MEHKTTTTEDMKQTILDTQSEFENLTQQFFDKRREQDNLKQQLAFITEYELPQLEKSNPQLQTKLQNAKDVYEQAQAYADHVRFDQHESMNAAIIAGNREADLARVHAEVDEKLRALETSRAGLLARQVALEKDIQACEAEVQEIQRKQSELGAVRDSLKAELGARIFMDHEKGLNTLEDPLKALQRMIADMQSQFAQELVVYRSLRENALSELKGWPDLTRKFEQAHPQLYVSTPKKRDETEMHPFSYSGY